jgi:aminoglycoside/choline kinase family phosphotransferase
MLDESSVAQWCAAQGFTADQVNCLGSQASGRTYYRAKTAHESRVVMHTPIEDKPAEIGGDAGGDELPFRRVRDWLDARGIPVPHEFAWDPQARLLMLEDLGDLTLEDALEHRLPEEVYGEAIDLLARLHETAKSADASDLPGLAKRFDATFLRWELDHFREYLIEARGVELSADMLAELDPILQRLAQDVAAIPEGFVHRDYQSRNLMAAQRGLVVIDFQDALRGPFLYDLVALLRDSYVEVPEPLLSRLIERYRGQRQSMPDATTFRRWFDLQSLQRKLKDAGRFVYIDQVKGNPDFLQHIPLSLTYVDEAFDRLPDYADLRRIIAPLVPELKDI